MSLPKIVTPSGAELMEKIRSKGQEKFIVLHPSATKQIEELKNAKRWHASENADGDYKTVIQADITQVLRSGVLVQAEEMVELPCWSCVVNGYSSDGIKMGVSLYLMKDDDDPLVVMSFSLLPDETDI